MSTFPQLTELTVAPDDADEFLIRDVSAGADLRARFDTLFGSAARADTGDLTEHKAPSGVDKVATLDNLVDSGQINTGTTESVTLSSGVLTIPAGKSTIKLPPSVWDGTSNITISGFAFENGVQPEAGYEFALVIPRTEDEADLTAGSLGNEVLLQHGTSLQVGASGFKDLPCYPNAADNPDADAVQFAAPYYRLKMRVEEYDGGGDPVVSVEELPGQLRIENDRGVVIRNPSNRQALYLPFGSATVSFELEHSQTGAYGTGDGGSYEWVFPAVFPSNNYFSTASCEDAYSHVNAGYQNNADSVDIRGSNMANGPVTGAGISAYAEGEWY